MGPFIALQGRGCSLNVATSVKLLPTVVEGALWAKHASHGECHAHLSWSHEQQCWQFEIRQVTCQNIRTEPTLKEKWVKFSKEEVLSQ